MKTPKASRGTTESHVYRAIARSLVEFGYPDVTEGMIVDIRVAYDEGKRGAKLPHGIVGMFAERQIEEAYEHGLLAKENK
jgi:hypothetical protein